MMPENERPIDVLANFRVTRATEEARRLAHELTGFTIGFSTPDGKLFLNPAEVTKADARREALRIDGLADQSERLAAIQELLSKICQLAWDAGELATSFTVLADSNDKLSQVFAQLRKAKADQVD